MRQGGEVYDLGELDERPAWARRAAAGSTSAGALGSQRRLTGDTLDPRGPGHALSGTLSLLIPGAGHVVRGELTSGTFFLATFAFLGALSWALLETMDRLASTLDVLGYPREAGVCALAAAYLLAAILHISNVASASAPRAGRASAPHPMASGLASALLPGWGQLLNGDLVRAVVFLAAVWISAGVWIVASAPAEALLRSLDLVRPDALSILCAPGARWTLIALVWSLAVYDAVASALRHR